MAKKQMRKHKQPKGASKKAASALNKRAKQAPSKRYGKPVMKKTSGTRSIGYASTAKTNLPDYKPKKRTTKTGRRSLKK